MAKIEYEVIYLNEPSAEGLNALNSLVGEIIKRDVEEEQNEEKAS